MKLKYAFITYTSALALTMLVSGAANAQSSCTNNASPGSTNCTNLEINAPTGNINIAGTISNGGGGKVAPSVAVTSSGSANTLNISSTGRVENADTDAIFNRGKITSLQNSGTITSTASGGNGVNNLAGGTITSLNNVGIISGTSRGITNGSNSTIGVITNSGSVSGLYGVVNQSGTINGIINSGTIATTGTSNSYGIYNIGGTIETISNSGAGASITSGAGAINNSGIIVNIENSNSALIGGSTNAIENSGFIVNISNSSYITSGGANAILNDATGSIDNITNSGTIASSQVAITNNGLINTVVNSGTIAGDSGNVADKHAGIRNKSTGSIESIQNSGTISGTYAIDNIRLRGVSGYIGTINNSGTNASISASATAIQNAGVIAVINNSNSAVISGQSIGIENSGQIGQINNSASIRGVGSAIANDSYDSTLANITSITNSGSIVGADRAITNGVRGVIGTITNTGLIQGTNPGIGSDRVDIYNNGTITTLNNAQKTLYYQGNLPTNYNIIINSASSYGSLNAVDTRSSVTAFGISPLSPYIPVGSSTYTNVLSGGTGVTNLAATSGVYSGFVTTAWTLTPGAAINQWDLNVTSAAVAPVVTGSSSGQAVANAFAVSYNSNCASSSGSNPTLANGKSFCENSRTLSSAQMAQVGLQSNAEGYSSNRTIRLEQMNTVSNTVLDRIDSPAGKGTNAANRVQLDDGRYLWGDIGGSRGNVNSYNNLASFGYNLVDVIIGGDLGRDSQKSYGVFGGVGYSDMTNSQTVVQSFNSTSYYLGGYGSYYLPENLKLSGVGGYVYSSNNSSRSLPSVAGFTGGNGKDSYGSNGIYAAAKVSKDYVINDSFTLVPFAGQSYAQFWTKGVTETGGGDFNVSIASATSYSTVSFAGLDLVMPLVKGVKDPLSLITFYKFGYDWFANSNSAHSVTATYTNLPLAPQTYVGANMGPISQQIGVGLQGAISKDVTARIGAVASFNTNGQEYGGGAELRFKF